MSGWSLGGWGGICDSKRGAGLLLTDPTWVHSHCCEKSKPKKSYSRSRFRKRNQEMFVGKELFSCTFSVEWGYWNISSCSLLQTCRSVFSNRFHCHFTLTKLFNMWLGGDVSAWSHWVTHCERCEAIVPCPVPSWRFYS